MYPRAVPAALIAVLTAVLTGCGGSGGGAPVRDEAPGATPARYRDAAGDGGALPDIRRIDVTSTPRGRISFRVELGQVRFERRFVMPLAELWLDTDADPETGDTTLEGAGGADYVLAFYNFKPPSGPVCGSGLAGNGCLRRWSGSAWTTAAAPSARLARTASGFRFSINRSDLGVADEFNFFAVRRATPYGFADRAPGTGTFNYSLALGGPRATVASAANERTDKAGGRSEGKRVVLTLATHDYLDTNPEAASFMAALEKRSGGSIAIDLRDGWRFDEIESERGTIADAAHGDVDLALVGARAWDTAGVTSFRALVAPFLVDSFALQGAMLDSPLLERVLEGVEARGLVGLAVLPGPLRRPLGVERSLVGPKDYRGADIGIRPGGVASATFAALGARAFGTHAEDSRPGELPGFDGSELDVTTILNNRYDTHARALTANVVLWPRVSTLVMNRKAFDALTSEQQELLRAAGREVVDPLLEVLRRDEQAALASLCRENRVGLVTASAAERAALRRAVQPVYDELERDALTRDLITGIETRGSELASAPEPLRCSTRLSNPTRTALDGLWRADLTPRALLAAGASRQEVALIRGPMTLDLDGGAWVGQMLKGVLRGTYSVDGEVLRLTVHSCRPKRICAPGQASEYRWSLYRDKLTLSRSRRFVLPALVASLWTRDN